MSILDAVNEQLYSQNQVVFLNDHYRSKADIIAFSNEKFYEGQLNIIRSYPGEKEESSLVVINVNGERNSMGINVKEVEAVIEEISKVVDSDEKFDKEFYSSIGVISPFRSQVQLIKSVIRKEFSNDQLKNHKILVGTPYHFQGEERDVVILSFVVDNDSHPSTINYLNKDDVFNVSITRARNLQIVLVSINPKFLNETHLLGQYLNQAKEQEISKEINHEIHDAFMKEVIDLLNLWKIEEVYPEQVISGVSVDIAVVQDHKICCIDLIGYPGDYMEQFSPQNLRMLNRMKQNLFFIPYSNWYLEREEVEVNLRRFFGFSDVQARQ